MIAYFLSNISAKYYTNSTMHSRVIAKNIRDVFLRHSVVNDMLSHTVLELSQLIVQILDTAFLSPLCSLGTTYDVHLWLNGKRVVDFLLVLIELFFR